MANYPMNIYLIFVASLCLLGSGMLACPGVDPDPLLQESIVPERDLTPRNFNPHPYVSVAKRGGRGGGGGEGRVDVLSNFDHPYAAVASKRSWYFRNGPNTGVQELDNDPDPGRTSINSLANFARRFLGLADGFNGKKPPAVWTNDAVIDNVEVSTPPLKLFASIINNYPLEEYHHEGYRAIEYYYPRSQNGQLNNGYLDGSDGDGDGNGGWITPHNSNIEGDQRHKLYLGKTLNFPSVQQSSLNEDALSPRDTNDNLSQGFYVRTHEDHSVTDAPSHGIESHEKPLYFITPNPNYRKSIIDELYLNNNRYSLYLSL